MNLTELSIKNNRVTLVLLFIVVLMGITGYQELPRNSMPPFTIRVASVVTAFPGAGPERVETLITSKIEEVAQEIAEVNYISSESRTGLSVVSVALKDDVPANKLQPVWDRLRRKIEAIQGQLPSGIHGPDVKDDNVGVVYGISIGIESDGFEYNELKAYAEAMRDELIKLPDAARVEIGGIIDERIFIDFNMAKLADLGLSSSKLQSIISSTNIIVPAGEVKLGQERVILEPSGNLEDIESLRRLIVPVGNQGETVNLGDITNVYRGYISPREAIVRINGSEGLAVYVSLKEGANIIQLGEDVDAFLLAHGATLPVGISVSRIASQDYDVATSVNDFVSNVIQSIVIVLGVMLLFLGLRTGLVVASLIPAAIILTLMLMNNFGVGLNQVSLAALIMALGMLVDNAIVIAESIMVKMENGEKALDAAISSSSELMVPLLISSLTTSAAFLAFFLAESTMGEIMGQLFSVITMALLSSWLMALTIIPLLAVAYIRVKKQSGTGKASIFDRLAVYYKKLLPAVLKRPLLLVAAITGAFFLSLFGFGLLPFNFMPDSDRNLVTLNMNFPQGTAIENTAEAVGKIEDFINNTLLVNQERQRGIVDWSSFIGVGPRPYDLGYSQGEQDAGYAHMLLNTSAGEDNLLVIDSLERFTLENIPDADFTIKQLTSGGGASVPIQVRISGGDPQELFQLVDQIKQKLTTIPGTKNIDDNWGPKIKKFYIDIDPARLSRAGITNQDVAVSLNTTLSGFTVGEFREDDESIPMVMREAGNLEMAYEDLESLSIFSQSSGRNVPLAQVAEVKPLWQFAKLLRRDLTRTVTVQCQLKDGFTANEVTAILTPWLAEQSGSWPKGYAYEFGGESESSSEAMGAVARKLPLSGFIILFLLVLQFNSMRKTAIVLSTVPLGIIGVVAGLLVTGSYFSFTGFLGVISLAGIVINNAIVLIDRIEIEQNQFGREPYAAIVAAASERFRPILLTTFTTSLGLIPLWLGGGAMWEPMAIGIIFGLLFATLITLLFVPVMYKLLFRITVPA